MEAANFDYEYHASALGLGGVLKQANGATTIVPSLASVALAPTGGEGFSEIMNYYRDGVSFSSARSRVTGYDSGYQTFTTTSDIYVTNLNLFDRVKVAILQTNVSSTRNVDKGDESIQESKLDSAAFRMHAMIRGLSIDGVEVVPELDLDLCDCPTYAEFTKKIGDYAGTYANRFGVDEQQLRTSLAGEPKSVRASFVSEIKHGRPDKLGPRKGFKLPVKNFGHVHFGELIVKPGHRRVNLLRLEFDSALPLIDDGSNAENMVLAAAELQEPSSPSGGSMTVLSHDSNGVPIWPRT